MDVMYICIHMCMIYAYMIMFFEMRKLAYNLSLCLKIFIKQSGSLLMCWKHYSEWVDMIVCSVQQESESLARDLEDDPINRPRYNTIYSFENGMLRYKAFMQPLSITIKCLSVVVYLWLIPLLRRAKKRVIKFYVHNLCYKTPRNVIILTM